DRAGAFRDGEVVDGCHRSDGALGQETPRLTVGVEQEGDLSPQLGVAQARFGKELVPRVGRVFLNNFEKDGPYLGRIDVHGTPRQEGCPLSSATQGPALSQGKNRFFTVPERRSRRATG